MLKILTAVVFASMMSGCAPRITPPQVELAGIEVRDASITHLNFTADLRIYNPNRQEIEIGAVSYDMELNGQEVFSSVTYVDEPVPPDSYITVPLRISSAFWDIISMFSRLAQRPELVFRLSGSVEAGLPHGHMGTFDFERTGKLDLKEDAVKKVVPERGRGPDFTPPSRTEPVPSPVLPVLPDTGDYI